MTVRMVIGAIIVGAICWIVDEGSFFSKLALAALVAAVTFVLLRWIIGWELMITLAKISAALAIFVIALRWIKSIFS